MMSTNPSCDTAQLRKLSAPTSEKRDGWRYAHVQAIIVSIDQYAEAALGNREYFLNKPYGLAVGCGTIFRSIPLCGRGRYGIKRTPHGDE
jgi:hypothetical protein